MPSAESALPALVARHAHDRPDAPFVVMAGGETWTYGEAHRDADRWASALSCAGVGVGDTVLTMLPPGTAAVAAWLGVARLRALEVPINTGYVGRMLSYVLADSRAKLMVAHVDHLAAIEEAADGLDEPGAVVVVGAAVELPPSARRLVRVEDFLAGEHTVDRRGADDWRAAVAPGARDIASIIYTSGTTGASKGVLVTWRQAELTAEGIMPSELFDSEDAFYSPFPMFHASGKAPLHAAARLGACVIMRPRFDTAAFWTDVRDFNASTTILLGAMANFLRQQPERPGDKDSPLRDVLMLPLVDDVAGFEKRFDLRVRTAFNMTETACCIVSDGYKLANETSCGRIRPGFQARVVDDDDVEVAPGELGELVLRGDEPWTLMAGYWAKPQATVDAWRNQWLHTGDGFIRDAGGNFYFVDRIKDAIRRRGENISSFEVEIEVNSHPDVLESAAVAVPSEFGEDEIKVVVVPQPGSIVDPAQLRAYLVDRMARFMVPRYVEIAESLPKTPTQKVRKVDLRTAGVGPYTWDGQADRSRPHAAVEHS
jgi:crotonobetaine/carnitine-CoA ligase